MRSLFLIGLFVLTLVSAKPRQANEAKRVRRASCSQTYTAKSGVITSHAYYGRRNYNTDIDCHYTIMTGLGAGTVYITIEDLDLERENSCSYDYLRIGTNTLNSKKLCGTERGTFIYNNIEGGLTLDFISDFSVTGRGFKISYKVSDEPCAVTLRDNVGVLTSPKYGLTDKYANYLDCGYVIETGAGKSDVNLVLKHFDVESARNCMYDYLNIMVPHRPSQKLCGIKRSGTTYLIKDVEGSMMLNFYADGMIGKSGFLLEYQVLRGNSSLNNTTPSWNNTNPSWNYTTPSWNNTTPSWNYTTPSWNNTNPSWNNTNPSWNNTTPSWNNTNPSWNYTTPSWNNTNPSWNYTTPSWNNTNPSWNNTNPSWNNTNPSWNYTTPSWNNTNPSWNYTTPSWNNTNPSWNYTTPSWNNTTPSWNNTNPSWNYTTPSWNNTNPSWNYTLPSWNYTTPSWNNTGPSWNNTNPSWNNTSSFGNQTLF